MSEALVYIYFSDYEKKDLNLNLKTFQISCVITSIVLFIVNMISIVLLNNIIKEADIDETTPSDFTILVKGISKDYNNTKELLQKFQLVKYIINYRIM
jgi:hypothetical protein